VLLKGNLYYRPTQPVACDGTW